MRVRRTRRERKPGAPIRIAYLTPTLQPGGAERQMLVLAAALPRDRFDVRFIVLADGGAWASEAEALGVPVHVLGISRARHPIDPRTWAASLRALRRYIALTRRLDVVDAWLVPAFTFAGLVRPLARVPVLIGGRRSLLDLYASKPWYRRAAAALATRQVDHVVTNTQRAMDEAIEIEGVDRSRVSVIPNAVLAVVDDPAERARWRAAWGVADDAIVVGCVANYKAGKGLEALIDAVGRLRAAHPALRLVLIGEGPLRGELEARIADLDLGSVVTLAGAVEDARRAITGLDVAVQASRSEGLPNAVLEAAAAGRPIVATNVGGTADIVDGPATGILVPPDDLDALTEAIGRLAADPVLRADLGRAARVRAGDFSVERLTASTAALYERLVADARR